VAAEAARRSRVWLVADTLFLLMFAFSVVVQVNDPDPWAWMAIYALAGVACALALANRSRWWFPMIVSLIAIAWSASIAPRVIGKVRFLDMFGAFEMKNIGIEESREMYGLLLIAVWMAVLVLRARTGRRGQRAEET
jgi:hypothetical protein